MTVDEYTIYTNGETKSVQAWISPDEHGGFWVTVSRLPGCVSQGDTIEEAKSNIAEALRGLVEFYHDNGLDVPWSDPGPKPHPLALEIRIRIVMPKKEGE